MFWWRRCGLTSHTMTLQKLKISNYLLRSLSDRFYSARSRCLFTGSHAVTAEPTHPKLGRPTNQSSFSRSLQTGVYVQRRTQTPATRVVEEPLDFNL